MSLAIDVDRITAVLLPDGWHTVADQSFTIDAYEYLWNPPGTRHDPDVLHGGGQSGVCASGFAFRSPDESTIAGPLTAIAAVRTDRP